MSKTKNKDRDDSTFIHFVRDVVPLKKSNKRIESNTKKSVNRISKTMKYTAGAQTAQRLHENQSNSVREHNYNFIWINEDPLTLCGIREDQNPKKARTLRSLRIKINASLDLHGFTQQEALDELHEFIEHQHQKGNQTLRIIHGKGRHSATGESRLRPILISALTTHPLIQKVSALATAHEKTGGSGATIVCLAK